MTSSEHDPRQPTAATGRLIGAEGQVPLILAVDDDPINLFPTAEKLRREGAMRRHREGSSAARDRRRPLRGFAAWRPT